MVKNWRPEGYKNPFRKKRIHYNDVASAIYEIGFDACLEALKQKGKYILDRLNPDDKGGWLVFIPDNEAD